MSDQQHVLLVEFTAKPGKESQLKGLLTSLVTPTREEAGCVEYRLHFSPVQPNKFMFYEIWANREAHAEHGKTNHMAVWHAGKGELVESVVKSEWLEVL